MVYRQLAKDTHQLILKQVTGPTLVTITAIQVTQAVAMAATMIINPHTTTTTTIAKISTQEINTVEISVAAIIKIKDIANAKIKKMTLS